MTDALPEKEGLTPVQDDLRLLDRSSRALESLGPLKESSLGVRRI